jgi:lysozyme
MTTPASKPGRAGPIGIASLVVVLVAAPISIKWESIVPRKYLDPVGIATACAGETDPSVVNFKAQFTRDECVAVLGASLLQHAQQLEQCVTKTVQRHEAVALLLWSHNVGVGAACGSTLVRLLNAGRPASEWCAQLSRWDYAGGKRLPGLTRRRAEERAICEGWTAL